MTKTLRGLVVAAMVCVTMVSVGCNGDKNEEMAQLRQREMELMDDYQACQDELMAVQDERDRWHDQYLAARQQIESLNAELAAVPEVPEGWTPVPGGAMIAIDAEFLFNSGQAKLRKQAIGKMDEVVATIQQTYPEKEVVVYGHTDDEPIKKSKWADNFELSTQRALSVVRQFAKSGIEAERLVAAGCGEYQPIAPNETPEGRQQNRRVEIYVLDPQIRTTSR